MKLLFISNGDGTCCVKGNSLHMGNYITIPSVSPDGDIVTTIGDYAFSGCTHLTRITIPPSVTNIKNNAFEYCFKLTNITIPDSVTNIGSWVFANCTALRSVTIPNGVTSIDCCVFYYCKSLENILIPSGVMSINNAAFEGCTSLTSVAIPDSVRRIGYAAFRNCTNLTSIAIPESVKTINHGAFSGCTNLIKTVSVKATNKHMRCRGFQYKLGEWYHEDDIILCHRGFHYVKNAFDVFDYYNGEIGQDVRFFKVMTKGTSHEKSDDSKRVCMDICLYEEITSYKDLLN